MRLQRNKAKCLGSVHTVVVLTPLAESAGLLCLVWILHREGRRAREAQIQAQIKSKKSNPKPVSAEAGRSSVGSSEVATPIVALGDLVSNS